MNACSGASSNVWLPVGKFPRQLNSEHMVRKQRYRRAISKVCVASVRAPSIGLTEVLSDESDNERIQTHRYYDDYEDSDPAESSSMAQRRSTSFSFDEEDLSDPELLSATRGLSAPSKPARKYRQTKKGPPKQKMGRRKQSKVKGKESEVLIEEEDLRELDEEGENHKFHLTPTFAQPF